MPIILALGKLKHEDQKCAASLGYIARTCLKNTNKMTTAKPRLQWFLGLDLKRSGISSCPWKFLCLETPILRSQPSCCEEA
jgi:hypothetical protein